MFSLLNLPRTFTVFEEKGRFYVEERDQVTLKSEFHGPYMTQHAAEKRAEALKAGK